ncbi:MAG: MarR family transcriptional regulator [Rhodospirillales bacterium]|nr:MarR family transcriptional regulator [Rhodospirillales bacterium]MCB9995741.1 MarR family transcriptional regulator [Rhodospirillales bacterium]
MQPIVQDDLAAKANAATAIIDHLVDALGGEPACKLMRAIILVDIDEHRGTNQSDILDRLDVNKSALTRDIEWLYDYGCITRTPSLADSRVMELRACGYAKKNIDLALAYFDFDHKSLKNFLNSLINLFGQHKPTLRDAKIVSVIGKHGSLPRQKIFDSLYNGPTSTDNRAVNNLINFGLVQKKDDNE